MDNSAQVEYWNGPAGERWALEAEQLDRMLAPFAEAVIAAADIQPGQRVLDVGCGSGALSREALEAGAGQVTGVDVSEPMLKLARQTVGAPADFVQADAADWQAAQPVERLVSRFGVMFFDDPEAAFANLRHQLKPGGKLAFACWQPFSVNEWASAPLLAVLPLLKQPPQPPEPGAPGPFAFEDADRTVRILQAAGWSGAKAEAWTGLITLPGDDIRGTADFMTRIGPTARLMAEQEIDPAPVLDRLVAMLESKAGADGLVRLPAAAWIVTATA